MVTIDLALYVVAFALFVLAACPTGSRYRFEWAAFAALTLTLVV